MWRGGGFITQSIPTYFHQFFTRKILSKNETIEDFEEITSALKTKIENSDASFIEPPLTFVDQWNVACGNHGKYNTETGYFELNGLTDITYTQAILILQAYSEPLPRFDELHHSFLNNRTVRTGIPHKSVSEPTYLCSNYFDSSSLEVVLLSLKVSIVCMSPAISNFFGRNPNIRAWLDEVSWFGNTTYNNNKVTFSFSTFNWYSNHPFEYFRFKNVNFNIQCAYFPNIGLNSFQYLVDNRFPLTTTGANPITITVHPNVYAKLIDETNTEWYQLLLDAAELQIQFVTNDN